MDEYGDYAHLLVSDETPVIFPDSETITSQMEEQDLPHLEAEVDEVPARPKRLKNFTVAEDKLICSSWLEIGLDATIGNQQRAKSFWGRIYEQYLQNVQTPVPRSKISVEHRWGYIQSEVVKFCGFYDKVVRLNRSGTTYQDKIDEACSLFEAATLKKFTLLHCWNILKGHQRWTATLSSLRGVKPTSSKGMSSASPGSFSAIHLDDDSSPSTESNSFDRPIGKKAAKKRSREIKASRYNEVMTEMSTGRKESEEKWAARHAEVVEIERAKKDVELKKLELKSKQVQIEESRMIEERKREEERIMMMDLSGLDETQRRYFMKRRQQILEG